LIETKGKTEIEIQEEYKKMKICGQGKTVANASETPAKKL
jgi:hypothetical protein